MYKKYEKLKRSEAKKSLPKEQILPSATQFMSPKQAKTLLMSPRAPGTAKKSSVDEEVAPTPAAISKKARSLFDVEILAKDEWNDPNVFAPTTTISHAAHTKRKQITDDICDDDTSRSSWFLKSLHSRIKMSRPSASAATTAVDENKPKVDKTPKKRERMLKQNTFKSPIARPGQKLIMKQPVIPQAVSSSPESKSPTKSEPRSSDVQQAETGEKELVPDNAPKYSDDESLAESEEEIIKQEPAKLDKKPIMGKRQTSKRRLEPVATSKYLPQRDTKKRRQYNESTVGRRLKLEKKRGKKARYVDHSAADRAAINITYTSSKNVDDLVDEFDFVAEPIPERDTLTKPENAAVPGNISKDSVLEKCTEVFGIQQFRPGQFECIARIVHEQSTLLILPTGSGKSLCYMVPLLLDTEGMAIVVSPMISLMEDQVQQLPAALPGACLNSDQSMKHLTQVKEKLYSGVLRLLFVSPEKLSSPSFLRLFQHRNAPKISFVCIDEVHCISEWSHNFRPAFFNLNRVLKENLGVKCVLGLTASATLSTRQSICNGLGLDYQKDIIAYSTVRENLHLSVSRSADKMDDLIALLQTEPYKNLKSIIVYVMRQTEADQTAATIRTRLKIAAASYHAGKEAKERSQVYKQFMEGKTRIVCATIAFGLGINKKDVRAIIHYSLPKSIENYVQETGRSGRDGDPAYCHLLLNDEDYFKLRSLACTDIVDLVTAKRLIDDLFNEDNHLAVDGTLMSMLDLETLEMQFDIRRTVVLTMLSYLAQSHDCIQLNPSSAIEIDIVTYKKSLPELAKANGFIATLKSHLVQAGPNHYRIKVPKVCLELKMTPAQLMATLYDSKTDSSFTVKIVKEAACVTLLKQLSPQDRFQLSRDLNQRMTDIRIETMTKIDMVYALMMESAISKESACLSAGLEDYFETDARSFLTQLVSKHNSLVLKYQVDQQKVVADDIEAFIQSNGDHRWSGRAIARIFHGITSPRYGYEYARGRFWAKHVKFDFMKLVEVATEVLKRC